MLRSSVKLLNKTAFISGSTSGIGLAYARGLAKDGCNIMLNSFEPPSAAEASIESLVNDYGVKVQYYQADMKDAEQIENAIHNTVSTFGTLDILINNAGMQFVAAVDEFPVEKWDDILALNLSAAFHASRVAIPYMRAQKWGRIIMTASAHGLVASPHKSAYVAAKHGIIGLSKTIALECATDGITSNSICPGYVLTPLVVKQIQDKIVQTGLTEEEVNEKFFLNKHPQKEFVRPEDLGEVAAFLCSDAARNITGTEIDVDAGWTMQ